MIYNIRNFDNYDLEKLKKAKQLLNEVYEFNWGYPPLKRKVMRLETILRKLEVIITENEQAR